MEKEEEQDRNLNILLSRDANNCGEAKQRPYRVTHNYFNVILIHPVFLYIYRLNVMRMKDDFWSPLEIWKPAKSFWRSIPVESRRILRLILYASAATNRFAELKGENAKIAVGRFARKNAKIREIID